MLTTLICCVSLLAMIESERNEISESNLHATIAKTEDSTNCTCVPYYQCSEDSGRVITDGDGLLDQRGLDEGTCTGYFDVCCNATLIPNYEATPFQHQMSALNTNEKGCGFLKQMSVPWSGVLQVQYKNENSSSGESPQWQYKCGVSIVHPRVALTAAHCRSHIGIEGTSFEQYRVKVADYESLVVKAINHPQFHPGTLQNDLAVLFLRDELAQVGTICIPPPSLQLMTTQCTVTTWKKSGRLRIIEVPLVQHSKCEKQLRKTRLGKYFQLHLSFICAGGNSFQDACDGDGGSPLICPVPGQPGRYHQVGIVSWGIGCGERDTPGVYVNVAVFRNWIDDVIREETRNADGTKYSIHSYRY